MLRTVEGLKDFLTYLIGYSVNESLTLKEIFLVYSSFYKASRNETALPNIQFQSSLEVGLLYQFGAKGISSRIFNKLLNYRSICFAVPELKELGHALSDQAQEGPDTQIGAQLGHRVNYHWARSVLALKAVYTPSHPRYHNFTRLFNHRVVPDDDSLQNIITTYEELQGTQSGPAFATIDVTFEIAKGAVKKESIEMQKQAQQLVDENTDDGHDLGISLESLLRTWIDKNKLNLNLDTNQLDRIQEIDRLYAGSPEADMGGLANISPPSTGTYARQLFDLIYTLMKYKRKVGTYTGSADDTGQRLLKNISDITELDSITQFRASVRGHLTSKVYGKRREKAKREKEKKERENK